MVGACFRYLIVVVAGGEIRMFGRRGRRLGLERDITVTTPLSVFLV